MFRGRRCPPLRCPRALSTPHCEACDKGNLPCPPLRCPRALSTKQHGDGQRRRRQGCPPLRCPRALSTKAGGRRRRSTRDARLFDAHGR